MKFERAANYDKFALAQDAAAGELARALKDFACQNRAKGFKFESAYEIGCGSGLLTRRLTHDFKFEAPDGKQRKADALDADSVQTIAAHYPNNRANAFLNWFILNRI